MHNDEPEYVDEEYDFDYWRARSERITADQEARNIEAEAEAAYKAMYSESPENIGSAEARPHHSHADGQRTGGSFVDWLF